VYDRIRTANLVIFRPQRHDGCEGGFTFANFLADAFAILLFVILNMIFESKGMAERANQQAPQTQDDLRIKKLDELKKSASITDGEYARLRGR